MPNKNQPFQIDLSMIEKNKRKDNFKKPTKVTIEAEVSFLSNDNDNVLGDIE